MKTFLSSDDLAIHENEKDRRRRRYEQRTGAVHLRGGRRQNARHKGRGRPQIAPQVSEWGAPWPR